MSSFDSKIQIVMRQTGYNEEEAKEKLTLFQEDELAVIRDYMGIPTSIKKTESIGSSSLNQAIYKQLRGHLDVVMRDYRARQDAAQR